MTCRTGLLQCRRETWVAGSSARQMCYALEDMDHDAAEEATADAPVLSRCCPACGLHHAAGARCPVAVPLPVRAEGQILPVGTVLADRFEIEEATHHSGMSTIYRARDARDDDMPVAVKQVPAGERQEASGWLAREAGLLSSLESPHLPELLAGRNDVGGAGGRSSARQGRGGHRRHQRRGTRCGPGCAARGGARSGWRPRPASRAGPDRCR